MYQGVLNERVTEHYQQVKMEIFFFFVFLSIIFWYDCMMKLILQSLYRDHQCAKSMHHKQPVKCVHCTLGEIREIGSKQFPKRTCSNDTSMSPCKNSSSVTKHCQTWFQLGLCCQHQVFCVISLSFLCSGSQLIYRL